MQLPLKVKNLMPKMGSFRVTCLTMVLLVASCGKQEQTSPNIITSMPDFSQFESTHQKKVAFIEFLTPILADENKKIADDRLFILGMQKKFQSQKKFSSGQSKRLADIAENYNIDSPMDNPLYWSTLLSRVDVIPPSLAITQAALESAWGNSRFAVEGNNLFGHWCFKPGCGIVPNNRSAGKTHEVAKFTTINEAVAEYLLNLNQLNAYKTLRNIRAELRANNQPLTGHLLAAGLDKYSELGPAYVTKVRKIINYKIMQPLDKTDTNTLTKVKA